ncbi:Transcriptional regulator, TetR family [Streptomyces venezuelae]|uniref:TetR/AcrR family transcriptional regulator n=1 Tax=Streptomyces gardneri TaxID=66892 RepID=UPI0006BCDA8F|nr:TetR/AcrR family transcriptional regulator [Streptomyces gardneri]ALO08308.1 Transcriptional regulator, TetR family [Streptomyces venezuelae]QPK45531.1 TetR/AcrR family transcriptional regulator [Streptomyces gardneri]WRK36874.1 TetR family transcriptional regulator [Streptomyces venezuelae]CUM41340.1 Transcriptional regulator, TetR family [Streptomyces venezuelae]
MARTKEFDPDAALQAALDLFWARGYEATTMSDLVEHLGVGRASIYATFGNKHDLYMKAMDRYLETRDPELVEELSTPGPALPAVRALVRRFAAEAATEGERLNGCFVTNSAAELAPHDTAVARRVELSWEQIETLLYGALTRARAGGELPADRDPRALARMLLVLLQGIRVVGKASTDPGRVLDAAEQALGLLD